MQRSVTHLVALSLALVGVAAADLPKKMPVVHYSGLWNNSPFTSKPPPAEAGPEVNPLEDYALIGVSPIGATGHRVTLINKKTPEERIFVDSNSDKSKFKILSIARKDGDPKGTTVKMSADGKIGTVAYDDALLALASGPVAKPAAPAQPGQVPQPVPQAGQPQPVPQPGGQAQRQPRPRVVPAAAPPANATVPGQRPGAQPTRQGMQPTRPGQSLTRPKPRGN
mgnify:FL=1